MFNAVGKIYLALKQMRRLEVIATLFCPITDTSSSHWSSSPTCSPRPPRSTPRPHPGGLRVSWPAPGPGAPPGSAVSQRASAVRGGRGCRWSLRLWSGYSPPPRAASGWAAPAPGPCRWRGTWCSGSGCSPAPAPRPRRSPGRRSGTAWAPPSPPAPPCAGRRHDRSSSSGLQLWLRWLQGQGWWPHTSPPKWTWPEAGAQHTSHDRIRAGFVLAVLALAGSILPVLVNVQMSCNTSQLWGWVSELPQEGWWQLSYLPICKLPNTYKLATKKLRRLMFYNIF